MLTMMVVAGLKVVTRAEVTAGGQSSGVATLAVREKGRGAGRRGLYNPRGTSCLVVATLPCFGTREQ